MGMGLRFSPLKWLKDKWAFDFGGAQLINYADNRPGLKFYVDVNITTAGFGKSWSTAFDSIRSCITYIKANYSSTERRNCTIYVAPGDYDEGASVALDIRGMSLIGPGNFSQNTAMIYDAAGAGYNLMTIDNHEITVDGIGFSAAADTYSGIVVSGTTASYKVTIRNCRLDGWSGEYGIYINESPDILVEHNLLRSWNTAAIYSNATRGLYQDNIIHIVSSKTGIEHVPSGGNRPDNVYIRNYFSGVTNTTTTGIKLTGTPSDGTCIIADNKFCGTIDTNITATASQVATTNYYSDNAGGALVDATT